MLSRRTLLFRSACGLAANLVRPNRTMAAPPPTVSAVRFPVPPGACDCHTHLVGDPRRFAFAPTRGYTPGPAPLEDLQALHRALHIERVIIVQPSFYGTDHSCILDAIAQLGTRARGIASIDDTVSNRMLDDLHGRGIRGIRVSLARGRGDFVAARERFATAVARVKDRGWHLQLNNTSLAVVEAIRDTVRTAPVPVVIEHFGGAQTRLGVGQAGFESLLDLVRTGHVYVKISAPYHVSKAEPAFDDVMPLVRALVAANPQRVLWGTAWPHASGGSSAPGSRITDVTPYHQIDDGLVLNQLEAWVPNPEQRRKILVENPERLYGF